MARVSRRQRRGSGKSSLAMKRFAAFICGFLIARQDKAGHGFSYEVARYSPWPGLFKNSRHVVGAGFSRRGRTTVRLLGGWSPADDLRLSAHASAEADAASAEADASSLSVLIQVCY